jgi:cell division protease FtsH
MSDRLGHLTFGRREGPVFLGRDIVEERNYSEQTAVVIDEEIRRIIDECYARAKDILTTHKDELKKLAEALLEKEVLDANEVKKIVGLGETVEKGTSPDVTSGQSPDHKEVSPERK